MGTALYKIKEKAKLALFDIKDILDDMGIEFVLLQGTLLGAIRENDFIDTDEDMDLGARIYDVAPRVKELVSRLHDKGFGTKLVSLSYKFTKDIKIFRNSVRTDLVTYDFYNNKMFRSLRKWDKIKVYDRKFIDNLKEIDFLGKQFKVFSDAEEWLEIEYGAHWIKREHRSGKFTTAMVSGYWEDIILKNKGIDYGKNIEDILKI